MSIYQLGLIPDIEALGLMKMEFGVFSQKMWVSRGANPLKCNAIFKCTDTTPNEVFGYVFASVLGMPVPDFQGVWFEDSFMHPDKHQRQANSMGLFARIVKPSREIYLLGAAQRDKMIAASNLLLRLFLGDGEYPQILISGNEMYFYDLEWVGPLMSIGSSKETLESNARRYVHESSDQWGQVWKLACEYDIEGEFASTFKNAGGIIESPLFDEFSVVGQPQLEEMSRVFANAVSSRYYCVCQLG